MSRRYAAAHPCPRATKTAYPDRETAELALVAILAEIRDHGRQARPGAEKVPTRCYRCPCGRWHLTSLPAETSRTR
jgi:hypothetical protein